MIAYIYRLFLLASTLHTCACASLSTICAVQKGNSDLHASESVFYDTQRMACIVTCGGHTPVLLGQGGEPRREDIQQPRTHGPVQVSGVHGHPLAQIWIAHESTHAYRTGLTFFGKSCAIAQRWCKRARAARTMASAWRPGLVSAPLRG